MASYLPPTESLPIFDNMVFDTNNTTALTYATAKNLFVTFPSAQGSSTITDFIAGTINYLSPSSGSFFNIGTNQVSGGTIQVGPTGTSGVSVHAGNIDCTNDQINNAADAALNNLSLGNLQTSGILNIGTGARVLTGSGGAINIGTGSGAILNPINIGGAGSIVHFTNGLKLASSKYITTSHSGALTIPSSLQVGHIQSVTYATVSMQTSNFIKTVGSIALASGVWIITGGMSLGTTQGITKGFLSLGDTSRAGTGSEVANDSLYGNASFNGLGTNGLVTPTLTSLVSSTGSGTTTYFLNVWVTYATTTPTYQSDYFILKAIRIA